MGLVATSLLRGHGTELSEDDRKGLANFLEGVLLDVRRAETQLVEVLERFAERGLPVIPLKGPLLAHSAYPSRGYRASRDLDLMVRPDDVAASVACLVAAGFEHEPGLDGDGVAALRGYTGEYIIFRRGSLPVEPHWQPAPRTMAFDIDMDAIWRRDQATAFLGARCHVLAPEDHFFLLAVHGAKEQWCKLKWLADIAAFQTAHPALDLRALRESAAARGCRRVLDVALLLSHRLFAVPETTPPSDAVTTRLADGPGPPGRHRGAPKGPYVVTRFHWLLRERSRDRSRYAPRTLFTPRVPHYRRLKLPPALRWLHLPLKLPWDHMLIPAIAFGRRLRGR